MDMDQQHLLDEVWCLYYHDPHDMNWTPAAYQLICTITSAEQFWFVHHLANKHLATGMFFLMREHVFPLWDDAENINGSCISLKIAKNELTDVWEFMCCCMLTSNSSDILINGISVSPKKNCNIIKLWTGQQVARDVDKRLLFPIPQHYKGNIFVKHNNTHQVQQSR